MIQRYSYFHIFFLKWHSFSFLERILDWTKSRHCYWRIIECAFRCERWIWYSIHFYTCYVLHCPSIALSVRRNAWAERVLIGWVNDSILFLHIRKSIGWFGHDSKPDTNLMIMTTIHCHRSNALATCLNTIKNICVTFNSQDLIISTSKFYNFI